MMICPHSTTNSTQLHSTEVPFSVPALHSFLPSRDQARAYTAQRFSLDTPKKILLPKRDPLKEALRLIIHKWAQQNR